MTRDVLETDEDGNPTVVIVNVPEDDTADEEDLRQQMIRGYEVAQSLATA